LKQREYTTTLSTCRDVPVANLFPWLVVSDNYFVNEEAGNAINPRQPGNNTFGCICLHLTIQIWELKNEVGHKVMRQQLCNLMTLSSHQTELTKTHKYSRCSTIANHRQQYTHNGSHLHHRNTLLTSPLKLTMFAEATWYLTSLSLTYHEIQTPEESCAISRNVALLRSPKVNPFLIPFSQRSLMRNRRKKINSCAMIRQKKNL
jgi:hypothetical protein